jgi:hypothetical protein
MNVNTKNLLALNSRHRSHLKDVFGVDSPSKQFHASTNAVKLNISDCILLIVCSLAGIGAILSI